MLVFHVPAKGDSAACEEAGVARTPATASARHRSGGSRRRMTVLLSSVQDSWLLWRVGAITPRGEEGDYPSDPCALSSENRIPRRAGERVAAARYAGRHVGPR